jgi:hypothetical protein
MRLNPFRKVTRQALWIAALAVPASVPVALRAADPPPDHVFVLPPFLVEEARSKLLSPPEWTYAQAYGLEVLSACDAFNTELFMQRMKRRQTELALIIPDQFIRHTTLPTSVILIPTRLETSKIETMVQQLEDVPGTTSMADSFRPLDALRLSDPDSDYLFVVKDDETPFDMWRGPRGLISPTYIYELVNERRPALPVWFCFGITRLFRQYIISRPESKIEPEVWPDRDRNSLGGASGGIPGPLLPMDELFISGFPEGKSDAYVDLWEAQTELFARWAFTGAVRGGREALWRFANAAAAQPVREELFRSCFGMDFATAQKSLTGYMTKARWMSYEIDYPPIETHDIEIRSATPGQIHRIKGEWARRVLRLVRARYPKSLPAYISETSNLLEGAFKRGESDPLIISSLALYRIDTGDAKGGELLLEQNPEAVAARPLAGLALAQLHMIDGLRNPAGPGKTLSEDQAATIMGEISATFQQAPPMRGAYVLQARVLEHLSRDPSVLERGHLNASAWLFSNEPELVIPSASWDLRAGDVTEARRLIEMGLWQISDPSAREKLLALKNLAVRAPTASK